MPEARAKKCSNYHWVEVIAGTLDEFLARILDRLGLFVGAFRGDHVKGVGDGTDSACEADVSARGASWITRAVPLLVMILCGVGPRSKKVR